MDYEYDFSDQEKINAINTAKDNINLSDDHFFLETPESICEINHKSNGSITAKVRVSFKSKRTDFISTKIINLKFHDNGVRSFWSYVDSANG